ncbi:hypothetical protein [Parendozoicomonas sp. Alg238-R29]|uniref:hypothetical protein n=1 Tax=Parendozoicomonas sp. Alg238-R29 TaxID=2993446 RepID=UPI00248EEC81|nr:hypothetical protein [Parendozoicomonas sp. Alg238-R29]
MVYRKTVLALFLGTALTTSGLSLASNLSAPVESVENHDLIALHTQQDVTSLLVGHLRGKTVKLTGELSQVPPMQQIPQKTFRDNGTFAEYYPYTFQPSVEGVTLPSLIFYSKTQREPGTAEVTGIFNEQSATTGTKGSGMLYLRETDS